MVAVLRAVRRNAGSGNMRPPVRDELEARLAQVLERLVEVRMAELVAEVERPPRHHALAGPEHRPELASRI